MTTLDLVRSSENSNFMFSYCDMNQAHHIPPYYIAPDALIMNDVKSQNSCRKEDDGCHYQGGGSAHELFTGS